MMRFLTILFLLVTLNLSAQFGQPRPVTGVVTPPPPPGGTVNIVMGALSFTADSSRSSGSTWNENSGVQIVAGLPPPQIYYRRFTWADMEQSNTPGGWKFDGTFREKIEEAIRLGQRFAFGIMQMYPENCSTQFSDSYFYDNRCSSYPEYVHDLMNASGTSDWSDGTNWIPNYNHTEWLNRWRVLNVACNAWLDVSTYTPPSGPRAGQLVRFKDVIAYIDLRGYGSYGEWHHANLGGGFTTIASWPGHNNVATRRSGSIATLKTIIDIGADSYPNHPVCIIINVLDGGFDNGNGFQNTKVPIEVGIYALTKRNAFGPLGLRRDQWGDFASYYISILQNNNMTFGGVGPAKDSILTRYKYNYITGEPPGYSNCNASEVCRNGVLFGWIPEQARILKAYNIGNGNWGGNGPTNQSTVDSIKRAWREMGSRVLVTGGTMTATLQASASFNVTLDMRNIGLATEHRAWTTQIILKNSVGTTVFTGTHNFAVKGFNTSASSTPFSTNFVLGAITPGTGYNLYIQLVDPLNYAQPYQLWNTGQSGRGTPFLVRPNITVLPST